MRTGRMDKPRSRAAGNKTEDDGREAEERGRRTPAAKLRGTVAIAVGFGRSILSVWQKHLERLAEALWVYIFFTIVVCILFLKVIIGRKCLWNG